MVPDLSGPSAGLDAIQPFQVEGLHLSGRVVRLSEAVDRVLAQHAYPDAVSRLLGELMALAAALGSGLKFDGRMTVETRGDGPIRLIAVDYMSDGQMRGYASYDAERVAAAEAGGGDGGPVPRLIGNTGEYPEFIVPKIGQNEDGSWPTSDYAFPAGMWTLSAHEARPGHEMQFTTMLRGGVSTARALFAFNSANVEGWALYAESIAKPYMPLDGQLMSLQARLLRAARVWLDPAINLGLVTPAEAKRVLMEDVVEDDLNAQTEIDRYTFRSPAQATAYYYGYNKLQALRAQTELALRDKFDAQAYHDFILAQGLLPPAVLHKSVMDDFVAPKLKATAAN